jgi:predicted metal-dependent peptidase
MSDLDRLAAERVQKVRVELIQSRRFYGVLVSNIEPVISRKVRTAATNSKQHFYNPDSVATLSQDELLGQEVHETEHDARHHSTRRMGRDLEEWNVACDLAIDQDIIAEGFTLPAFHLEWLRENWKEKYRGLSAEDIYRIRELEKEQPEQPEQGDGQSDDEGQGQNGQGNGDGKSEQPDDGEPETGGDAGDDEQGEGESQGQDGDDSEGEGNGEGGEGESQSEGQGQGQGGEGGEEATEGNGDASHDAGRCGEVLDAPGDAGDLSETDVQWERIVRQAASMAKAVGQLPGHITREIERANNPTQDWREVLRAWFDGGASRIETWNRPNRRFIGGGLYLPGTQRDGVNKVVFAIDTSGSMDEIALRCVGTEAQAALDERIIDEIVVVYGDTRVTRVDTYHVGDEIEFDPRGGGGTELAPLFDYVAENHDDASLIVCFTDLYVADIRQRPEPHCPVLFAVTGYPDEVRKQIANAPWKAPAVDVGVH